MATYIETERLKLRDWKQEDLLPFQKMNANPRATLFSKFIKLSTF